MRGIADAGGFGAVAQLAIDHTGKTGAGAGLGQHGDSEAGPDQILEVRETRTRWRTISGDRPVRSPSQPEGHAVPDLDPVG